MFEFILEHYNWFKAVHYMGFISWMAGLFYLPRLFVYHSENKGNSAFISVVKIQEKKLFFAIQTPAMFITLITGIAMLVSNADLMKMGHIHAKLLFVLLLLLYHFDNFRYLKQLESDTCKRSGKFFRAYNEIPTLLMIAIVVVMIAIPF